MIASVEAMRPLGKRFSRTARRIGRMVYIIGMAARQTRLAVGADMAAREHDAGAGQPS